MKHPTIIIEATPSSLFKSGGTPLPLKYRAIILVFLSVLTAASVQSATNNWKASTTGDWATAANWVEGNVPTEGDDVIITNAGARVTLSSASSNLNSFILSRTLVFTNWGTYLSATEVTILSNGLMTCPGPFTNNVMSNRVWIVCSNLFLANGASINVNTQGYAAIVTDTAGQGPGGPSGGLTGAAHGSWGGNSRTALPYGSTNAPESPGSSGSRQSAANRGTHGGGAVRIDATGGAVTINGAITANAGDDPQGVGGQYGGCGSGGSVFITCRVLAGTNGTVSARGGNNPGAGGSGGGGRIAVNYDTNAQAAAEIPTVSFSARAGSNATYPGDIGTLWFPDNRLLITNFQHSGHIVIDGWSNWSVASLTITNAWVRFPADGMRITVSNDLVVSGANARLELGGNILADSNLYRGGSGYWLIYSEMSNTPALFVGGNALLTGSGSMYLYATRTNAATPEYGALLSVTGNVTIGAGSALHIVSHPTNDGNVFMVMSNLLVMANGSINANERGYAVQLSPLLNFGPGKPGTSGGAGHGGRGGFGFTGGQECDSLTDPRQAGSSGANYNSTWMGSSGGGLIRIRANDTVTVNGTLTANARTTVSWATGGAGGAINITSRVFRASGGVLRADGGGIAQSGGTGSGGRIAIHYDPVAQTNEPIPDMTVSLTPGANGNEQGQLGTLYLTDGLWITNASGGNFTKISAAMPQFSALNYTNLLVSNCWVSFPANGAQITVSSNARIEASGRLYLGGGNFVSNDGNGRAHSTLPYQYFYSGAPVSLECNGSMTLTNGGRLYVYAGPTNGAIAEVGGEVNVSGALILEENSWIYPLSHLSNGGNVRLDVGSLYVETNAGIYAAYSGYSGGYSNAGKTTGLGLGGGAAGYGGGYGGRGGGPGGSTYGLSNAPVQAGSGGGAYGSDSAWFGGAGGGLVWVRTPGRITLRGTLNANGESGSTWASGGSGGGILLDCKELIGSGMLTAQGGAAGNGRAGGGGRISIWWGGITDEDRNKLYTGQHNSISRMQPNTAPPDFTGTNNVSAGTGGSAAASNGTVTLLYIPPPAGTMFVIQ